MQESRLELISTDAMYIVLAIQRIAPSPRRGDKDRKRIDCLFHLSFHFHTQSCP